MTFAKRYWVVAVVAVVLSAQLPKPGGGGGGSSGLVAGTDYAKPALYDTFANVSAATCASAETGRIAFTTDSVYTARCSGSAWQWFHHGISATPPPSAGWSWDNQGTGTISSTFGFEYLTVTDNAQQHRVRYRAAPGATFDVAFKLKVDSNATTYII